MEDTISAIVFIIIFSIFYVPFVWWLYTINKKLGEKNPWLALFPILQFYSIIKASWKSLWWILWSILIALWIYILIWIISLIIYSFILLGWPNSSWINLWLLDFLVNNLVIWIIIMSLLYILLIALINTWYIIVLHWISKRTKRWFWTTLWLFYIPFIMFPIVAYKLKDQSILLNLKDLEKEETIEL